MLVIGFLSTPEYIYIKKKIYLLPLIFLLCAAVVWALLWWPGGRWARWS